jgi:hypothetical protein
MTEQLRLNVLGGSAVLLTYLICLPPILATKHGKDWAWAGIQSSRAVYGTSMVLTAISYMYLVLQAPPTRLRLNAFTVFLIGAACWAPALLAAFYNRSVDTYRWWVFAALCITSVGAIVLLYAALTATAPSPLSHKVIGASVILAAHIVILDNVIWGGLFVS